MTAKELLLKTAERLETIGWMPNGENGPNGELCLVRTMTHLDRTGENHEDAYNAIKEHLGCILLSAWNDQQTSSQPVIDVCRKVAAKLS